MNKRITEIGPGVVSEAFSDSIQVHWNPLNEESGITFNSTRYLKMGDDYISRIAGDTGVFIGGTDFHQRSFEINGKTITGLDVDYFTRLLYDALYNEQVDPDPDMEPEPEEPSEPPSETPPIEDPEAE